MPEAPLERLAGVVERILFANEENHHTIAELRADERRKVVITGRLPGVQCGETVALTGRWTHHRQHGEQFAVETFEATLPASVEGIRKYLGSGFVKGVGPVYAERIVERFGADTLRVLAENSARLREVQGIGEGRLAAIRQSWEEQRALREILIFLQTYGVGTAQALRIVKKYGAQAPLILRNDPYRVAREVDTIGFRTADKIALNLGLATNGPPRLDAGLLHALGLMEEEGHTAVLGTDALALAARELDVPARLLEPRLAALTEQKQIAPGPAPGLVQLPNLARAEDKLARALRRVAQSHSALPPIKVEAAVAWAAERAGFAFAEKQAEALRAALSAKLSVLTGGPGTGKTTILRALSEILRAKRVRLLFAAPTGRAAQRLAEATGAEAATVHRLLKFDPAAGRFTVDDAHPLACDYLVVDEASMLDTSLAAALAHALPPGAHLCLVGDVQQLPSVGPGQVLQDVIASGVAAVTALERVYRQAGDSGIVAAAHAILAGERRPPVLRQRFDPGADCQFVQTGSGEDTAAALLALLPEVAAAFRLDPVRDLQVLVPMRRGATGLNALNPRLRDALNPRGAPAGPFRAGDKVMQTRNNYDLGVFNGDIGFVTAYDQADKVLLVDFDGNEVAYERAAAGDLVLAYAISIHKSQGSEFPAVVLPLLKEHFMMLRRNLLYTGLTRAKKAAVLLGEPAAWSMAVGRADATARQTGLCRRLETPPEAHLQGRGAPQ